MSGKEVAKEVILASRFRLTSKINAGSFGVIYYATDISTGCDVAVKTEQSMAEHPMIPREAEVYEALQGCVGVPRLYWYGYENGYNAIVMDLLGPSLENLFHHCGKRFTMKTVLLLAVQMLDRIQTLHDNHFIHRDIKPDNFLMGNKSRCSNVYIVDFGMSKMYRDGHTGYHMPCRVGKKLNGTARYTSINTHLGVEQSRRDDMEAIGYVLMYFNLGSLPWQGITGANKKEKHEKVKEKKLSTSVEQLCQSFPQAFSMYLNYTQRLRFDETPDYMYLRQLFIDLFYQNNFLFDHNFDWNISQQLKAQSAAQPEDNDFRQAQMAHWDPNNPRQQ